MGIVSASSTRAVLVGIRSGEQWERPSPTAFERMSRIPPVGIPGVEEFYMRHRMCLEDRHQQDHAFLATGHTVGLMCDRLEAVLANPKPKQTTLLPDRCTMRHLVNA